MSNETRRCEWCGDITQGPCGCPAETEIDRMRQAERQATEASAINEVMPDAWKAVGGSIWNHKTSDSDRPLYDQSALGAVEAAERERCIATLRALKDDSGVNDDCQAWLRRLTRGDCVAALVALGPNVKLSGRRRRSA